MVFSEKEFDIMVDELLYREPISFDMLCRIADKTLRNKVNSWCKNEDCLRGRGFEDDIMQEIHFRLMKTTISYFLLKDGIDGPINYDPKGFSSWMFKVAENLKKDFAGEVRNGDFNTKDMDDSVDIPTEEDDDTSEEKQEQLKEAFSIVLSADVNVYKILTWLAQFVFVIEYDITKIKSNEKIIETFEKKTLFEMYDMILAMSKRIDWVQITDSQHERIMEELNKPWDKNTVYGNVEYHEFFMKVNGKKSGKKSISDWMNRMNNMLRRKIGKKYDTENWGEGR